MSCCDDTNAASDANHGDEPRLSPRSSALYPFEGGRADALSFKSTLPEPDCNALID